MEAPHQRRTFARTNGLGGQGVPHLVAAEERHRKNLQHIQQLKQALCSTVSAAPLSATAARQSRGLSLQSSSPSVAAPSPAAPAWGGRVSHSNGMLTSPTLPAWSVPLQPIETPTSAAVLRESQQEVEQLVREKHQLQRRCVELASLVGKPTADSGSSAVVVTTAAAQVGPPAWSPLHAAALAVVEEVARCYPMAVQSWAIAKDLDAASHNAERSKQAVTIESVTRTSSSYSHRDHLQSDESGHSSDLPEVTVDELVEALHGLAAFLPQLESVTAVGELIAQAGPDLLDHIHILEQEKRSDCLTVLSITDHLTKVSSQLRQEAAEKQAALHAMQQTVNALMEEKSEWARRARASEEALAERYTQYRQREKAWEREVAELLHAKEATPAAVPSTEARPAEVVAEASDVEYGNRENAAAAAASGVAMEEMRGQLATLEGELEERDAALASLRCEHEALQTTHAALQMSSRNEAAAQRERIAELESKLHPLESEVQVQADTIRATLQKVEKLTAAHQAEAAALTDSHRTALEQKEASLAELRSSKEHAEAGLAIIAATLEQRTAELTAAMTAARDAAQATPLQTAATLEGGLPSVLVTATPIRLTRANDDDGEDDGGNDTCGETDRCVSRMDDGESADGEESVDAIAKCTNVRKLQQSLKRMSRERASLKRKLEHRGTALSEMEAELEAAQRMVAQYEARLQVLESNLEKDDATVAVTATTEPEPSVAAAAPEPSVNWIDFSELESGTEKDAVYPRPVDLSAWLVAEQKEPMRFADYAAQQLTTEEQLRVSAVGPLYHVGFTLLKAEGLLDETLYFPVVWRRFLLQLQEVLSAQLVNLVLSPVDSVRYFYTLASASGLLHAGPFSRDLPSQYTLLTAALCVCLLPTGDVDAQEANAQEHLRDKEKQQLTEPLASASPPQATASSRGSAKWRCCQAILRHVCAQGDGEDDVSRAAHPFVSNGHGTPHATLTELASQSCPTAKAGTTGNELFPETLRTGADDRPDGVIEIATAPAFNVASLLSNSMLNESLPVSCFALHVAALQEAVHGKAGLREGPLGGNPSLEMTPLLAPAPSPLSPAHQAALAPLLLYLARHECVLSGWRHMTVAPGVGADEAASMVDVQHFPPSLASLGERMEVVTRQAETPERERTSLEEITELLMLLGNGLLPAIILSLRICGALEQKPRLLHDYFEARHGLLERRGQLISHQSGATVVLPTHVEEVCSEVPLLSVEQLRQCIHQVLSPISYPLSFSPRMVQVPTAEYERLHRELLSLYQTNDTYYAHLQDLLGAAESTL